MPKPGLVYERPSPMARALIVCFSLGVVVMAGWLVMTVLFSHDATATAEDPGAIPPIATKAPPRIEDSPAYNSPLAATALLPSQSPAPAWPDPPSADSGARPSASESGRAAAAAYATSSVAPDAVNERAPADAANSAIDGGFDPRDMIPLPQPRPHRVAIPVPRPRPRIDDTAVAQVPQERTLFDILMGR
jgi:DNA segregation ATPase FtsK/SpoIIIE, S-DNA-T family